MPHTNVPEPEQEKEAQQFDAVRSLLLGPEHERLQALEAETRSLQHHTAVNTETMQKQIAALQSEITALQKTVQSQRERADTLQVELEQVRTEMAAESEALFPRLIQRLSGLVSRTIQESRDEMAEALGPIMGDAIRVQIRDSRKDMVEALYPIIIETVQRAIAEFTREIQRNIDARLRMTFGPSGALRTLLARLRGVSPSQLALRDALPFVVQELFLIQQDSGLLLAHVQHDGQDDADSDLIGGMLTAVRDFTQDSFGETEEGQELDEIQYGDQRVIIQSGQYVYLAAVIEGVEPEGFRTRLRQFVSQLHVQYKPQLRDYNGDPQMLPDLKPRLADLSLALTGSTVDETAPMGRSQQLLLWGGGALLILFLILACFYLQFTVALLPVAFGNTPTPSLTLTASVIDSPTNIPTNTPMPTATSTAAAIVPPSATSTLTPPPTISPTSEPTTTSQPTMTPLSSVTNAAVWVRPSPDLETDPIAALPAGTPVTILGQTDVWLEVQWSTSTGVKQGWIPVQWIDQPLSNSAETETQTPDS